MNEEELKLGLLKYDSALEWVEFVTGKKEWEALRAFKQLLNE